jgi:hypothetical protein
MELYGIAIQLPPDRCGLFHNNRFSGGPAIGDSQPGRDGRSSLAGEPARRYLDGDRRAGETLMDRRLPADGYAAGCSVPSVPDVCQSMGKVLPTQAIESGGAEKPSMLFAFEGGQF